MDISLAICTYNNARLLKPTLETVARQIVSSEVEWEVIVVDNNCSDSTQEVVEQAAKLMPPERLRLVVETKQGLSWARRCAFEQSQAKVLAFVDDDCLLDPHWVQSVAKTFEEHPNAGLVGGRVQLHFEEPPSDLILRYPACVASQDHGEETKRLALERDTALVGAGLAILRKAIVESNWLEQGILPDRSGKVLTSGGDTELVIRIMRAGYEAWYNPAIALQHIIPPNRMQYDYIRKLHVGFGKADPYIYSLKRFGDLKRSCGFRELAGGLMRYSMAAARSAKSLLSGDSEAQLDSRLNRVRSRARFKSALSILLTGE